MIILNRKKHKHKRQIVESGGDISKCEGKRGLHIEWSCKRKESIQPQSTTRHQDERKVVSHGVRSHHEKVMCIGGGGGGRRRMRRHSPSMSMATPTTMLDYA